jgi:diguanylate cyclase (GGDEF)-like protein
MRLTTGGGPGDSRSVPPGITTISAGVLIGVIALLALIFDLDRATGSAPVQHLYYVPIVFAAVRFGIVGGISSAVASIALYHFANPSLMTVGYGHWDFVQVALFIAAGSITAKLMHDRHRLQHLATTDDLTGLHNLRSFEQRLADMIRVSRAEPTPFAMLVLDVDRLKLLNDAHGHLAGAEAVRLVGRILAEHTPATAVACRYGGDEFVIAMSRCTRSGAHGFADEIRKSVNAASPVLAGRSFAAGTLSISIGVACRTFGWGHDARSDAELGEALFRAADAALYTAKEHGRNDIWVA